MTQAAPQVEQTEFVEANLNYLCHTGAKPVIYISPQDTELTRRDYDFEVRRMPIHNGRLLGEPANLDREGFALLHDETAVQDFFDDDEVLAVYYPEVEQLAKAGTDASRVVVFDHTLRADDVVTQRERKVREPVLAAHNDYTDRSALQRVRDLLGDEAGGLLQRRFAIVNVWRSIRGPVQTTPLAICDARSIGRDDLVATDLKYEDRVGETQTLAFNPEHRWFYFPDMQPGEIALLKCYDSARDGRARFTAHTAFELPVRPKDAIPRESIEIRTLAFF